MSPAEKEAEGKRLQKAVAASRSFPVEFEKAATTPITIEVTASQPQIRLDVAEWIKKK
jgi:hypothetical protein